MLKKNYIEITGVSKSYGKFQALNNINLKIGNGMFGLLGHNGAGKTTLMKLLTTLSQPTKGKIIINGYDVNKDKLEVRRIVGFLPQTFNIYPQLTSLEFLDYMARLNGIKNKEKRVKLISTLLEKVNLHEFKDKKVGGFSGGMIRRLGIAQALVKDPKILIIDEPTAGLDPEERIRFRTMLVELSEQKIVILSTHIVEDISATCEHIALLKAGELIYSGRPIDFINTARDKVWEVVLTNRNDIIEVKNKYHIISMRQESEGIRVRIIATEMHKDSRIRKCVPNLEDALLSYNYVKVN